MKKVELLAPAGDLERLKIAILYGANAVFCGGKQFSLRAKANNFSIDDLKEAVKFANKHKAKVHVTVNIVPEDFDMKTLDEYLLSLSDAGVHAIIVSSIYIMKRAKELNCKFEVHVSTQQSIANHKAAEFFKQTVNVNRVVLARELNIDEIKEVKEKAKMPIEAFIHGGMCSSYSGRCTLSNSMANRDANKGGCAHSCRWTYKLMKDNKVIGDTNFIIASCDLMSIEYIPSLLKANVDSFKIEGRMKSVHYIATVVNAYRRIIDEYYKTGELTKSAWNFKKSEDGIRTSLEALPKSLLKKIDNNYELKQLIKNKNR
jgi:putative protease